MYVIELYIFYCIVVFVIFGVVWFIIEMYRFIVWDGRKEKEEILEIIGENKKNVI